MRSPKGTVFSFARASTRLSKSSQLSSRLMKMLSGFFSKLISSIYCTAARPAQLSVMRRDIPLTLAASAATQMRRGRCGMRQGRAAFSGPRPGRVVSSSAVAVLMLMIAGGGGRRRRCHSRRDIHNSGALRLPHRRDEEQRPQDNQRRCGSRQRCEFPGCLHGRVPHFLLNFNYSTLL